MKCVIPLARGGGFEKDTNDVPYLISVAGKPLLGHLIDQVIPLNPEEIIFVLGDEDRSLIDYVTSSYNCPVRFILQKRSKGSAHAIYGAREFVNKEVLILFGDTFFDANFKNIDITKDDAIIWTSEVKSQVDIANLGVVLVDGKRATKLIEKPDEPISNLAMIGLYFVKDATLLFNAIKYLLDHKIKTKGSYHLTDALQYLINNDKTVGVRVAYDWVDADHGNNIFRLNEKLLKSASRSLGKTFNSVVIKPSFIGKGAIIRDSVIGPRASIGVGSVIDGSVIRDSIVCTGVEMKDVALEKSIVATGARVKGKRRKLTLDANAKFNFD